MKFWINRLSLNLRLLSGKVCCLLSRPHTFLIKYFAFALYLVITAFFSPMFSWHLFLKKSLTVSQPVIRIADIGNIYGNDINQDQKNEILAKVISESPIIDINWEPDYIRILLERKFASPESIRGDMIRIIVPGREYSPEEIAALLESAYTKSFQNDYKIEVKKPVSLPEKVSFRVKVDGGFTPGEKNGEFVFAISNIEGNSIRKSIAVPYVLLKKTTLITASRSIKEGDRIKENDIKKSELWLDHNIQDSFSVMPIGYISNKKIDENEIIYPSDLTRKIDVSQGDSVSLEYSIKNLTIESPVKACEKGSLGQIIKFRTAKNKILYGQIITSNKAVYVINRKIN